MGNIKSVLNKVYRVQHHEDKCVCFFRIASYEECACAQEALQRGCAVFLDLSDMQLQDLQRMKDFMQGVCVPLHGIVREICEDYIAYFPREYHLQIFEN